MKRLTLSIEHGDYWAGAPTILTWPEEPPWGATVLWTPPSDDERRPLTTTPTNAPERLPGAKILAVHATSPYTVPPKYQDGDLWISRSTKDAEVPHYCDTPNTVLTRGPDQCVNVQPGSLWACDCGKVYVYRRHGLYDHVWEPTQLLVPPSEEPQTFHEPEPHQEITVSVSSIPYTALWPKGPPS